MVLATEKKGKKEGVSADCPVYSCPASRLRGYVAGRDGFWIDRCLKDVGVIVVDSASMQVEGKL